MMASPGFEREIKLSAPAYFQLPNLDGVGGWSATPLDERQFETVYFDTPDLRLACWGCTLRYRVGEGWTVKVPAPSQGVVVTRHEHAFAGGDEAPPEAATSALRAYVRRDALQPVLRLATRRRPWALRNPSGTLAAELVDDEVHAVEEGGVSFREIEIELTDGASAPALKAVLARLRQAGVGAADPTPKHVRALGARAAAPPEVVAPEVKRASPAADVVRRALARSIALLFQSDPGIRLGDDPEDVHQARVATRRLRSDLRSFWTLVNAEWAEGLRAELSWLAGELGGVRDREVLRTRLQERLADLPSGDAVTAAGLLDRLAAEEQEARRRLLEALNTDRYLDLLERLLEAARAPVLLPAAARPAAAVLPGLARRPWRRLRTAVRGLPEEPGDADLHRIRILAKRARYAAEAVVPVAGQWAQRFAAAVAGVQTVLGDHQDSVNAQAWLRGAAASEHAFVAGELLMAELAAGRMAQAAWPAAWKALDRTRLRRWMRQKEPAKGRRHAHGGAKA